MQVGYLKPADDQSYFQRFEIIQSIVGDIHQLVDDFQELFKIKLNESPIKPGDIASKNVSTVGHTAAPTNAQTSQNPSSIISNGD